MKMTNLKAVNVGMNKYCGPAVLSILTGKSTDECARVISRINGQYSVAGVQLTDLLKAADRMGFDYNPVIPANSLYGTIVRIAMANDDGMYIITVPNHFVTIEIKDKQAFFCDNHTREPIPAASSSRLGQKVIAAHRVIKRAEPPPKPEPVLLNKLYSAVISNNRLCIDKVWIYENPEDNRTEQIGFLQAQDNDELNKILRAIQQQLEGEVF